MRRYDADKLPSEQLNPHSLGQRCNHDLAGRDHICGYTRPERRTYMAPLQPVEAEPAKAPMRVCPTCGKPRPLHFFQWAQESTWDASGRTGSCLKCRKEQAKLAIAKRALVGFERSDLDRLKDEGWL